MIQEHHQSRSLTPQQENEFLIFGLEPEKIRRLGKKLERIQGWLPGFEKYQKTRQVRTWVISKASDFVIWNKISEVRSSQQNKAFNAIERRAQQLRKSIFGKNR